MKASRASAGVIADYSRGSIAIVRGVDLPERVFVLARLPAGGPGDGPMRLYTLAGPDEQPITPVFSSIVRAAQFLEGAQAAGVKIGFDYVFPATAAQLITEFAAIRPILDPAAEALYSRPKPPS